MARIPVARELQDRLSPVSLSRQRLLTVPRPLLPLFPHEGLQQGISVGFTGSGSSSVALALAAGALGRDGWMAVVGVEELGLLSAAELGVQLDHVLLIGSTGSAQLAPVVAALIEAVGIVAIKPHRPVSTRHARQLTARARERGTVLFHLDGGRNWPEMLDLSISTEGEHWTGLGQGHGHLQYRQLTVTATGRRSLAGHRRTTILLPGPGGGLAPIEHSPGPVTDVDTDTDADTAPMAWAS